ncbi:hypothetical protein C1707_16775 [Caulobacter flavus]|uniref:Uncharacterized protein n=1 Tax=Caulobacter flavus TaxID=1679497 RepID=A0ABN5QS61_9CAUL|nr:hypothetical protein C1707_16775 [Caulobacter flavus]
MKQTHPGEARTPRALSISSADFRVRPPGRASFEARLRLAPQDEELIALKRLMPAHCTPHPEAPAQRASKDAPRP